MLHTCTFHPQMWTRLSVVHVSAYSCNVQTVFNIDAYHFYLCAEYVDRRPRVILLKSLSTSVDLVAGCDQYPDMVHHSLTYVQLVPYTHIHTPLSVVTSRLTTGRSYPGLTYRNQPHTRAPEQSIIRV